LVLVGSSLLSESLFIPLVVGAVLAALRFRDDRRLRWVVVSGVLVGLGALTRGNGIVLLVPLVLLVWGRPWRRWGAVRGPAVLVVVAVLVLVPWTVRNAEVFGRFVPLTTETGYALAGVYNPGAQHDPQYPALWRVPAAQIFTFIRAHPHAEEPEISDHLTSQALDYVKAHAGSVPRTLFWSVVRLFNFSGAGLERYLAPFQGYGRGLAEASVYAFWLLLALAIGGAFTPYRRRLPRAMWTWPLMIVISCLVFEGDTRYRSPADPFFILLAAALIATIYHRRADDRAAPARRSDQLVPHA
jgi:4-amino-4-deoxy-L-arabinose transferase-like glycosyltransferase